MIDVVHKIQAVHREVAGTHVDAAEARTVILRQTYDATVDELWDACTNAERIPRWFLPITGELRLGGRYQLEGHAGGTITACEAPWRFEATWESGGSISWIAVELSDAGEARTQLSLAHTALVEEHWAQFGPGAVGVGWDLLLIGLTLHLASGGEQVDPDEVAAWTASDEGVRFMTLSSDGWRDAQVQAGLATGEEAAAQADRTLAAYTGTDAR